MEGLNLFPLFLSFRVAAGATAVSIIVGLPIAYALYRGRGRVADLVDSLTNLPIILPPTVLGYYLLVLLGRRSPLGRLLEEHFDAMIVFTPTGAVIAATVVSVPYMIKAAKTAFLGVNEDLLNAARLLARGGIDVVFSVLLPLSRRGILAGITMTFARALGDFGATLMVAGSIPGKTLTMPIAIYEALQAGDTRMANLLAFVMTSIAVAVLFIVNTLERKMKKV